MTVSGVDVDRRTYEAVREGRRSFSDIRVVAGGGLDEYKMDRSLQRLRKRGLIVYEKVKEGGAGWAVKAPWPEQ